MNWVEELRQIIRSHWQPGDSFHLEDVYAFEDELSRRHPRNRHVRAKIRQVLQAMRATGEIRFIDGRGDYRRLR